MECEVYGWAKQRLTRIDGIEIKTSDKRGEAKKKKNKNKRENSRVDDTHDSQTTAKDETTVMYKNVQTVLDEMVYFIYICNILYIELI